MNRKEELISVLRDLLDRHGILNLVPSALILGAVENLLEIDSISDDSISTCLRQVIPVRLYTQMLDTGEANYWIEIIRKILTGTK